MASSSSPNHSPNTPLILPTTHSFSNGFDPNSIPNTTFVQADPTTFRDVVQRLTGAATNSGPACKLHERRPTATKLQIKLNHNNGGAATSTTASHSLSSPARNHRSILGEKASPVSPLEYVAARRSPTEEEERAIADKCFYLHPSPLTTPRGSDPPELLPLFPLHSPRDHYRSSS